MQAQGTNSDVGNCLSYFEPVAVQDTVDSIQLISPKNAALGNFDQMITPDSDVATTIRLLD